MSAEDKVCFCGRRYRQQADGGSLWGHPTGRISLALYNCVKGAQPQALSLVNRAGPGQPPAPTLLLNLHLLFTLSPFHIFFSTLLFSSLGLYCLSSLISSFTLTSYTLFCLVSSSPSLLFSSLPNIMPFPRLLLPLFFSSFLFFSYLHLFSLLLSSLLYHKNLL